MTDILKRSRDSNSEEYVASVVAAVDRSLAGKSFWADCVASSDRRVK